jgi:hypothetical protein
MYWQAIASVLWILVFIGAFILVIVLENEIVRQLKKIVKLLQLKGENK